MQSSIISKWRKSLPCISFVAVFAFAVCGPNRVSAVDDSESTRHVLNRSSFLLFKVDTSKLSIPQRVESDDPSKNQFLTDLYGYSETHVQLLRKALQEKTVTLSVDTPQFNRAIRLYATAPRSVPALDLERLAKHFVRGLEVADQSDAKLTKLEMRYGTKVGSSFATENLADEQLVNWNAALEATKEFPVQCAVVLPDYVRETLLEIKPDLPEPLGGGSSEWLLKGALWGSFGMDLEKESSSLVVRADSEESATRFRDNIPKLLQALVKASVSDPQSQMAFSAFIESLAIDQAGSDVTIAVLGSGDSSLQGSLGRLFLDSFLMPIKRDATHRKLKELLLAIHNYHDVFNTFPTYGSEEKSESNKGLSWRVHILPFIGFSQLYNEFRLDEPWDSPHNIKLLPKMPDLYDPAFDFTDKVSAKPYHTTFVAPVGSKTVFGQEKPIRFQDITDGSSNTVAIVELKPEHAIPWTSPEEYVFNEQDVAAKLRSFDGKSVVAMFDGSTRTVDAATSKRRWLALMTRNGGEFDRDED